MSSQFVRIDLMKCSSFTKISAVFACCDGAAETESTYTKSSLNFSRMLEKSFVFSYPLKHLLMSSMNGAKIFKKTSNFVTFFKSNQTKLQISIY